MCMKSLLLSVIVIQASVRCVSTLKIPRPDYYNAEAQRILQRHNIYRLCHDAPLLELDKLLNEKAQTCANEFAANHSKAVTDGTNLFSTYHDVDVESPSPHDNKPRNVPSFGVNAVDQWYREQVERQDRIITNFSQVVWKSSKKLGVGFAQTDDGQMFLCCKYEPAGNILSSYDDNVVHAKNISNLARIQNCLEAYSVNAFKNTTLSKELNRNKFVLNPEAEESTTVVGDQAEEATTVAEDQTGDVTEDQSGNQEDMTGDTPVPSNDMSKLFETLSNGLHTQLQHTDARVLCAIIISACCLILIIIILVLTLIINIKICGLKSEDECCSSSSNGASSCGEMSHFNKSVVASASVPQSIQSYM